MAKLAHQPFEDWLLSGELLAPDQSQELHSHLAECALCQRLQAVLQDVEHELRSAPLAEPGPAFVERWQIYLVADQLRKQRRQTLFILLFSLGGAGLLLALLGLFILPILSMPRPLLVASAYELLQVFQVTSNLGETTATLLRTIAAVIPLSMWVSIMVALGGLCAIWVIAIQRLTSPRRMTV